MPSTQVLQGIRVLELGDFISAAYCARLLGDYGAEVIKVEPPSGDSARRHGPFPGKKADPESSGLFLYLNASKKGVTLDITKPQGREVLRALIRKCDVLVHNYLPEDLERLGLRYEDAQAINPALVFTSVTVFGQEGPYANYKGYAINATAASATTHRIGLPESYPLAMPYDRGDFWGGLNGAPATMLALIARRRDGKGQHVDISAVEAMNTFNNGMETILYMDSGAVPSRRGHRVQNLYPYCILPCKDGYFALIIANQHHWDRFVELMGSPAWSKEPRYQDRYKMGYEYPGEVDALVKPWLAKYTKAELWEMCQSRGIPWHPVQRADETLRWDHLKARGYWQEVHDGMGRTWLVPGPVAQMSRTPARRFTNGPKLGQHNQEIYGGLLKLPQAKIAALKKAGAI